MSEPIEVDLHDFGNKPTTQTNQTDSANPKVAIQEHIPDLSNLGQSGATTAEFLTQLIQTPDDQLIPWEECTLPSRGLYYPGWVDGTIMTRGMGISSEKIMANQRLAQSGQMFDKLFAEHCRFPGSFDPAELLVGDRTFLIYYLRGITMGNMYEFAITCPACNNQSTHNYDMNELSGTIRYGNPALGLEPFRVSLPYLSTATKRDVWVGIRFLRSYDINDMIARRRTQRKIVNSGAGGSVRTRNRDQRRQPANDTRALAEEMVADSIDRSIVNVMGIDEPLMVREFAGKLHGQDRAVIREWLRDNSPGIDNIIEVTCPNCEQEFPSELPLTDSFFRPKKRS